MAGEKRTSVAVVLLVTGSILSILLELSVVLSVLSLLPGFFVLGADRRPDDHLSWKEAVVAIVPATMLFIGLSLPFDLTGGGWVAVFLTTIVVALLIVERRRQQTSRVPHA